MSRRCITFLTDFGTADAYVGAMKGAALCVNPDACLVDISHEVPPQDIAWGAHLLAWAWRWFPSGTVHVAVVDPGVGSGRRILGAETAGQVFLAPDNGLLSPVLAQAPPRRLVSVTNASYFRNPVSATFHGRDVFAPVAAHVTLGVDLAELGPPVADPVRLEAGGPRRAGAGVIEGQVIHVDRFGNLITNITESDLDSLGVPRGTLRVGTAGRIIEGVSVSYTDASRGALLALVGSAGLLELAANCGSARQVVGAGVGEKVRVSR
ncbi:MAG TPA: SAM-dependent chlorinase/fluorinase [Planctomycetota bacterium]|nr:SAM-dependent chlorinase/fluorinase [Planctomycetota bacterium]HRR81001.1 SAM-dependent chlorinase/fluorinase [Planctomycetota bacterium]HRT93641.1 SAM-dependent chlorinase/fluorinase [Planctomycetota bacterium]